MARTRRLKLSGGTHRYHLMSRTNDKRYLFAKGCVKTELIDALKRAASFSGITINAYTAMDNHFHVVCTVAAPGQAVPTEELIRRYRALYGEKKADDLVERWTELEAAGFTSSLEEEMNRLRRRMNDISEFMKTFKEVFDRWYKRSRSYCGSLWSGRFKSTLVEDGEYFRRCKRYIQLNAVRAGIVSQVKDYRWVWSEDDEKREGSAGSVPETELMRRVVQIGAGKVLGSEAFVTRMLFAFGDRIRTRSAAAHPAGAAGYSSHGWRLAKATAAVRSIA